MTEAKYAIYLTIPTPVTPITELIDVVPDNIPFLLGLDLMRKHKIDTLVSRQLLISTHYGWRTPLILDGVHLYLRWSKAAAYSAEPSHNTYINSTTTQSAPISSLLNAPTTPTHEPKPRAGPPTSIQDLLNPEVDKRNDLQETTNTVQPTTTTLTHNQLSRIHRHFAHASAPKLYALLKRSTLTLPANLLPQLQDIVDSCNTCQEFSPKSMSFRVRAADKVVFNHRIILDLMWLPGRIPPSKKPNRPVLHIIDAGTRFNAATFMEGETSAAVWNSFLKSWTTTYIGMPGSMLVDQGSTFLSDEWQHGCDLNHIELVTTGSQSHNSLGAGESYHAYLRRIYNKTQKSFPNIPDSVALALSVKAINDCTGPNGLCPTLLVFGTFPQLPSPALRDHQSQTMRFRAAAAARLEYEKIVTTERIRIASAKPVPPATDKPFQPGDLVYVYREKHRRYSGPHMIASVHGKSARLHVGEKTGPR